MFSKCRWDLTGVKQQHFVFRQFACIIRKICFQVSKLIFSDNLVQKYDHSTNHDCTILKQFEDKLTRLPNIWLIAALSFNVHSATTFARISFMYNMKAFSGFFICGFFLSTELFPSWLFLLSPEEFFWSTDVLEQIKEMQITLQNTNSQIFITV